MYALARQNSYVLLLKKSRIIRESAKNNCMEVKLVRVHVKLILKSIHLDIVRVFKKRKEEKFLPKQNN